MVNKEDNMEILISKYLQYTPSNTSINKELEVRFNTRKFDNAIQKMDFDRVAQKLISMGFTSSNLNGSYFMRISSQYASHNKAISEVRA